MIKKVSQKSDEGPALKSCDALTYFNKSKHCVGWYPQTRDEPNWWIYNITRGIVFMMGFIYMPFGLLMTGINDMHTFTITDFFTYLQAPVNSSSAIIKTIIIYFMRKRFIKVLEVMDRMDDLNSGEEDQDEIQKCIKDCKKVTIIYQIIYYGYLVGAVLGAMAYNTTPYHLYNPYISPSENTVDLLIGILMDGLAAFGILTINLVADVYPIMYVMILRTHIHLLKQRIENLRSDPEKSEDENYDELVKCVKAHRLIIEYADLIRPVISNTVFVQLVCTGLLLGFSTVSIMFFDIVDRLVTVYYSMAILSQTFPFCYTCESLLNDCNDLAIVLLHSKWIGAERRFRKTLVLFMHQTQAPISFTACGVVQICLDTNIKMVKFAFSVFTIVQEMNLMEKFKK
ncbi:hypothetical protein KR074_007649 [Drosophila pseudoananassae]|nr:hypothetical protein KR074_007649 [Drosophila pseudoananassae]